MNPKHARFVAEYLVDLNATQAAIRAGYSARSAAVTACRLLTNAKICAAVQQGQAKHAEQAGITVEKIVTELATIGLAQIGHDHVKVSDKRAALVDLGKHLGMFKDEVKHSGAIQMTWKDS